MRSALTQKIVVPLAVAALLPLVALAQIGPPAPRPGGTWVQTTKNEWLFVPYASSTSISRPPAAPSGGNMTQTMATVGTQVGVGVAVNAAVPANAQCPTILQVGQPCWTVIGIIPVWGQCASPGVCKAGAVGTIVGGILNVPATMAISKAVGSLFDKSASTPSMTFPSYTGSSSGGQCPVGTFLNSAGKCQVNPAPGGTTQTNSALNDLLNALRGQQSAPTTVRVPAPSSFTQTQAPPQTQPQGVSSQLFNFANDFTSSGKLNNDPYANITTAQTQVPAQTQQVLADFKNMITLSAAGATIETGVRDTSGNIEVSAFFGGSAVGGASPSIVAQRMCLVRPWQNPFVSSVIPSSLFDGLCTGKNYQAGIAAAQAPAKAPAVPKNSAAPAKKAAPVAPTEPASVSIWAVPESVSLGARTTIYWIAKGVQSCTETSPDGSFRHDNTINLNGASTVPLTGNTVYTISCITPDGGHITDYVTVKVGI